MPVKSLYRLAKQVPPPDKEYLTNLERRGAPRDELPQHIKDSWDALSAFDSEEAARAAARNSTRNLGKWIVRYDIPDDSSVTYVSTPEIADGHYDIRGDKEKIQRYYVGVVGEV